MSADLIDDSSRITDQSDDDIDWEEVQVPAQQDIEIIFQASSEAVPTKKKGISYSERILRINCHRIHTICLLENARRRNYWINDPLLHARLLSLTPLRLQNSFAMIHKSRVPDQNKRGRLFESAMTHLAEWWSTTFFDVRAKGHIRNLVFDDVQTRLTTEGLIPPTATTAGSVTDILGFQNISKLLDTAPLDVEVLETIIGDEGECIRSSKSLMKHVLMRTGCRDTSAQLFTALCRALGIPARLIVSLQGVPWQANFRKPATKFGRCKSKGKGGDAVEGEQSAICDTSSSPSTSEQLSDRDSSRRGLHEYRSMIDRSLHPKLLAKELSNEQGSIDIRLWKSKSKGRILGSRVHDPHRPNSNANAPPVFWTEVFSRADSHWIPVDPVRCIVNKRKVFDPSLSTFKSDNRDNRMAYVLAFEEDGYARDVTRRYAMEYSTKVSKLQVQGAKGGAGRNWRQWWQRVVDIVQRPYRLRRDDIEDEELEINQRMEGMPTSIAGFKDHPLYILTRHLHQNQIIHPPPPQTPELGKFRGEPVYPRSAVVELKTSENWMRNEGRCIKQGCQPLKMVRVRAGTVGRMRELESFKEAGIGAKEEVRQGLYAKHQTELYIPSPVTDGVVPKNNFGNIDLYVPSMLPRGAVHIPFKGVAKIARKLGLDFAEAVTGFEFRKRRALPVIEGVVVATENEAILLGAYYESEQHTQQAKQIQREERVVKRWTRITRGLRIRQRLQEQYKDVDNDSSSTTRQATGGKQPANMSVVGYSTSGSNHLKNAPISGGGFLTGAEDVVQTFHLPKNPHLIEPLNVSPQNRSHAGDKHNPQPEAGKLDRIIYDLDLMDPDSDQDSIGADSVKGGLVPKTMKELAEDASKQSSMPDGQLQGMTDSEDSQSLPLSDSEPSTASSSAYKMSIPGRRGSTRRIVNGPVLRKRRRTDGDTLGGVSEHPSLIKRTRVRSRDTNTATPTRVLRPRVSKSQAQIHAEQDIGDSD